MARSKLKEKKMMKKSGEQILRYIGMGTYKILISNNAIYLCELNKSILKNTINLFD